MRDAFIANNRFGLGARPGTLAAAAGDPRGWLTAQLGAAGAVPDLLADETASAPMIAEFQRALKDRGNGGAEEVIRRQFRDVLMRELALRTYVQIESETPFVERLVAFWSNHFTASVQRPLLAGVVGAYEREAIRPHVAGTFRDLLGAVIKHPAMLSYLDNLLSFGPNSRAGRATGRGLNENLARELLELHTLGVDAEYTQDDVTALAMILTGWSIGRAKSDEAGHFVFQDKAHEPGEKTLLGVRFEDAGIEEGERALDMLASHPATARHVATKLARHFVADEPPADAVARLETVFRESGGDLHVLTRAIVDLDAAWAEPLSKLKTPVEFTVSALRALGGNRDIEAKKLLGSLRLMGQVPFSAPSPAGWPDRASDWASPQALMERAEWSMSVAAKVARGIDPAALLDGTIAPVAPEDTRLAVARAPDRTEAVAMLLACPEFQWR